MWKWKEYSLYIFGDHAVVILRKIQTGLSEGFTSAADVMCTSLVLGLSFMAVACQNPSPWSEGTLEGGGLDLGGYEHS